MAAALTRQGIIRLSQIKLTQYCHFMRMKNKQVKELHLSSLLLYNEISKSIKRDFLLKVLALFVHIHCTQVSTLDRAEFTTSDGSYVLFGTRAIITANGFVN